MWASYIACTTADNQTLLITLKYHKHAPPYTQLPGTNIFLLCSVHSVPSEFVRIPAQEAYITTALKHPMDIHRSTKYVLLILKVFK